jgi:hypothetical protein
MYRLNFASRLSDMSLWQLSETLPDCCEEREDVVRDSMYGRPTVGSYDDGSVCGMAVRLSCGIIPMFDELAAP